MRCCRRRRGDRADALLAVQRPSSSLISATASRMGAVNVKGGLQDLVTIRPLQ